MTTEMELALQASNAVTWSWDVRKGVDYDAGSGYRRLYGFTESEPLTIHRWEERLHEEDRERVCAVLRGMLNGEGTSEWRQEFRIVHPIRGVRWLWGLGKLYRDEQGQPQRICGVNFDITERKENELRREESERRFRNFIENAPVALAMFDLEQRYVTASRRWYFQFLPGQVDVTGKRHEELRNVFRSAERETWRRAMQRGLMGEVVPFESELWSDEQERNIWVRGEIRPWHEHPDRIGGVVVFAEDQTALKELTDGLRENQHQLELRVSSQMQEMALLQRAISNLAEGVAIAAGDFSGMGPRLRFINDALCRMTGYHPSELLGAPRTIFFGEKTDQAIVRSMVERLENGRSCHEELAYYRKDGSFFLAEIFLTPLADSNGGFTQFVAIVRDITERKLAEDALRDREDRLRAIFENAFNSIVTIDGTGRILTVNPATEKMFGYSKQELIGKNVSILSPLSEQEHDGFIRRYKETGVGRLLGSSREVFARGKDGTLFPIDLSVSSNGRNGFTGIMRDISELRELQQHVLQVAATEQRRIGQELHDGTQQLLTGLALYSSTLEKLFGQSNKADPSAGDDVWQLPGAELQKVRQIIGRLSSGLAEANRQVRNLSHGIMPVQIDAEGLVSALRELVESFSVEKGVECEFNCHNPVPIPNNTMATHLFRIAQEAVSNALRHGKATQIRIALRQHRDWIELEIRDNGLGIRSGLEQEIDQQKSRGMGLKLMKYRANLMGGNTELVSSLGCGTIFRCRVPKGVNE